MDINVMLGKALQLMGAGMGTVFMVLLIFFICVKLIMKIFPENKK